PPGAARVYSVAFRFNDPEVPHLELSLDPVLPAPDELRARLDAAARDARDCIAARSAEGVLPRALAFRTRAGKKEVELTWVRDPAGTPMPEATCVENRIRAVTLSEAPTDESLGIARLAVALPARAKAARPQATTMLGYELAVTAAVDGEATTKLRLPPANLPPFRLRANPVFAQPGKAVA